MPLEGKVPARSERHVLETLATLSVASEEYETYGSDPSQRIEWYGPATGQCIVFLPGSDFFGDVAVAYMRPAALVLGEEGYRVALVQTRRERGNPNVTLADLRILAQRPEFADAIWAGHSFGATLALDVVLDPDLPPRKVVALAPYYDLVSAAENADSESAIITWLGGTPAENPEIYQLLDPRTNIDQWSDAHYTNAGLSIQILHGAEDQTISPSHLQFNAHPAIRTAIVPAANHMDLVRPGHDAWIFFLGALRAD